MFEKQDTLYKTLSCPVCLDLFIRPVLELLCSCNYCQKCIKQTQVMNLNLGMCFVHLRFSECCCFCEDVYLLFILF
uniref:Zinc finger RING-type eukaryotic domain-containing protein n=1 Tax=Sinocyclocheilus rhinocerous TaxID=307959 RepID=A0A673GDZ8_9TELE